tara:strand:+ start:542 stop:700 length:159 start_codon:yes stop_codon:yes gene_type:complete
MDLKTKADKMIKANAKRQQAEDRRAMKQNTKASNRLKKYTKKTYKPKYGWEV